MIDRQQQVQREIDSDIEAARDALIKLQQAGAEGDLSAPRTQRLIARMYSVVAANIKAEQDKVARGAGAKVKNWLRAVPTDIAAVIAIRECISKCSASHQTVPTIQILASDIAKAYQLEIRIKEATVVNPIYMQRVEDQIRENATTDRARIAKLYSKAYSRIMQDSATIQLSEADSLQLGKHGVQACIEAGLITLVKSNLRNGKLFYFTLTPEVEDFLKDYNNSDVRSIISRDTGAMQYPPDDWHSLVGGGYLSNRRKATAHLMSLTKVRKTERSRLMDEFTAEKMPKVFECANYLQSVPFTIHKETSEAIRRVWESGGGVLGVPTKNQPQKPILNLPDDWLKEEGTDEECEIFSLWKMRMISYYENLKEWRAKVREIGGFMKSSGLSQGKIWFPVFMDTRGRWYYRGSPNPQGHDLAKGTLHFHNKKPLGAAGLYWLKVHIANCYGFDKERFDIRAKWTEDNWDTIRNALAAPEDHPDVFGTDAPWCMYSAAVELNKALQSPNPELYETGVPVHMDATCSGLQHFAAMLRDPIGGEFVNLSDDLGIGPKQDIYARVAKSALDSMAIDLNSKDDDTRAMAMWWVEHSIARSLAKKPVMTYCYSATLRGTAEYIQYTLTEEGIKFPEHIRKYDLCHYAAKKLFVGIANTVPAAASAMEWLKSTAANKANGERMEWTTPTGFKVQHDYQDFDEVRVKIRSCGIVSAIMREYNEGTRKKPMSNAVAPNFIHALDASHLTLTALGMKRLGLDMVGIHDSFGTHPCDVPSMHKVIREEFVSMYGSNSILSEFMWEVGGELNPPNRGTLKLESVLESEFFFC